MSLPQSSAARARPARLTVGVVGTGRVGAVLGAALRAAGHSVVAASGVSAASRSRAEALLPGVPLLDPRDVVAGVELALLAVPDDELVPLVEGLAATGAVRAGQLIAHPSGRHGVAVLEPATRLGALPLALHPAMTFTGTSVDLARLAGCSFAVTAPAALVPIGQALVVEMGGEPIIVAEADRILYAEAIATASDFSSAIVAQATGMLASLGIGEPGLVLGPLVRSSVENALARATSGGAGHDTPHRFEAEPEEGE